MKNLSSRKKRYPQSNAKDTKTQKKYTSDYYEDSTRKMTPSPAEATYACIMKARSLVLAV